MRVGSQVGLVGVSNGSKLSSNRAMKRSNRANKPSNLPSGLPKWAKPPPMVSGQRARPRNQSPKEGGRRLNRALVQPLFPI